MYICTVNLQTMKVTKSKDMKSVCFEFKNPKTPSAEPRLKFQKTNTEGEFDLILKVNETSNTDEITIKLGVVSIQEIEEIADILKTMSNLKNNSRLITD